MNVKMTRGKHKLRWKKARIYYRKIYRYHAFYIWECWNCPFSRWFAQKILYSHIQFKSRATQTSFLMLLLLFGAFLPSLNIFGQLVFGTWIRFTMATFPHSCLFSLHCFCCAHLMAHPFSMQIYMRVAAMVFFRFSFKWLKKYIRFENIKKPLRKHKRNQWQIWWHSHCLSGLTCTEV